MKSALTKATLIVGASENLEKVVWGDKYAWYYTQVMPLGAASHRASLLTLLLAPHSPLRSPLQTRWLLGGIAGAALLLASWWWSPTRTMWDAFDLWVFAAFNQSLADGPGWQRFWAYANHRGSDLLAMGLFGLVFLLFAIRGRRTSFLHRVLMGGFAVLITSICVTVSEWLFQDFGRLSPSLVVDGALRLGEIVHDVRFKDASRSCFPGDHGTAVICLTAFAWRYGGRRFGLAAAALAIVFVLPRVVVGAHWATDLVVGSVAFAVPLLCVILATPLHARVVDGACTALERLLGRLYDRYASGARAR